MLLWSKTVFSLTWIPVDYTEILSFPQTGLFFAHSHKTSCSSAAFKHKLKEKSNKQTDFYTAESDLHLSWITEKDQMRENSKTGNEVFLSSRRRTIRLIALGKHKSHGALNGNHLTETGILQTPANAWWPLVSRLQRAVSGSDGWSVLRWVNLGQAALGRPSGLKTSRSKIWTHQANQSWPHVKGRHAFCHGN